MITASDVYQQVSHIDPEVDEFIKDVLIPRFRTNAGKSVITVPEVSVRHYFDDKGKNKNISKREWVVNQLTQREFEVKLECEDRPWELATILDS